MKYIQDVIDTVEKSAKDKFDARVNIGRLKYNHGTVLMSKLSGFKFDGENNLDLITKTPLTPTDSGWLQLCNYLKVPDAEWILKNPDSVVSSVLTHWAELRSNESKSPLALLRCKGSRLRAVLSDQYIPLDNLRVMETLNTALDGIDQIDVRSYVDTDTRFCLKLTFPHLTRKHSRANGIEEYKTGIMIRNSETGHSSLVVAPFLYRLACTNDLVVEKMTALKHQHRWVTDSWLDSHMKQSCAAALGKSTEIFDAFVNSDTIRVNNPTETLQDLLKTNKYSQKVIDTAKSCFAAEPGNTAYSIINAVTAAGRVIREEGGMNQADSLESFGGELLFRTSW